MLPNCRLFSLYLPHPVLSQTMVAVVWTWTLIRSAGRYGDTRVTGDTLLKRMFNMNP